MIIIQKYEKILLLTLFLFILGVKLYFAFNADNLSYGAYYETKQVNNILKTGFPLLWDELSFSGRADIVSPIYYYILALFSYFLGLSPALILLPNLFVSLISIIIYLIVKKITQNEVSSFICAIVSGFVPVLTYTTLITGSINSLAFLVMFIYIYIFIDIKDKKRFNYFIILSIMIPFISPITLLCLIGLIFYFMLMKLDGFIINKSELETVTFASFFMLLALFVQYKPALIMNGATIVWQNIPLALLNQYFSNIDIMSYIGAIGLLPLIFGIYTIYKFTFKVNKSSINIIIGFTIAVFLTTWLKLVNPNAGLSLIALSLIILMGESLNRFISKIRETKFDSLEFLIIIILCVIFIFTSVNDTIEAQNKIIDQSVNPDLIYSLNWIKGNTPVDSVIFTDIQNGYLITELAERKNMIDNNFILITDGSIRYGDYSQILYTPSTVQAVKILNKYKINYILLNKETMPKYTEDQCFKLVNSEEDYLTFELICKVEKVA
ncbi:hypothetical protein J4418_01340 [Candidatus Woesearchaeota archaeon]|nr:hypothetical protein [Candidatus Woesearchaeota archaeon]